MTTINLYLNFKGSTEEAMNFYKSVIGGEFSVLQRFKGSPADVNLTDEQKEKIMHISYPIGNGVILMATDVLETSMGNKELIVGNNFSISLSPDSREDADKFFAGLSEGGNILMPLHDAFWGSYFGAFIDKYGINWMINLDTAN